MKPIGITSFFLVSVAALTACHDNFDYDEARRKSVVYEYGENFVKRFGQPDSLQDYNMAMQAEARVDLSTLSEETCDVLVYTDNPISAGRLLANYAVTGELTFKFDVIKGTTHVFVQVVNPKGNQILQSYLPLTDGVVTIGTSTAAAKTRAITNEVPPTTINWNKVLFQGNHWNGKSMGTLYYLNNIVTEPDAGWKVKDMDKIVGTRADSYYGEGKDNRSIYENVLEKDMILTMAEDGPVTISNQFGGTMFTNQFGYYYYFEGATAEETLQNKLNARKYVIMNQAEPQNNITVDGRSLESYAGAGNGGMALPNYFIAGYEHGWNGVTGEEITQGTKYRLVYFDQSGNASYNFPKDIRIGFFIKRLANYYPMTSDAYAQAESDGYGIHYSDRELNNYIYGDNSWYATTFTVKTTTTKIVNNTEVTTTSRLHIVGFEDGYDNDMNDILFFVQGADTEEITPLGEVDPDPETWIVACEDLGATDDFDFNDVVFSVSHVAGYNDATIKPLAAGGNLGSVVYHNGERLDEIHYMLDRSTAVSGKFKMLNTTLGNPTEKVGSTYSVRVPTDFSMSSAGNAGGFTIRVVVSGESTDEDNMSSSTEAALLQAPQREGTYYSYPQMLVLPNGWIWPAERRAIEYAYPNFSNWIQNASLSTWSSNADDRYLVTPY